MKLKLCLLLGVTCFSSASYVFAESAPPAQKDIYSENSEGNVLSVTWSGGATALKDVIGSEGETTRVLVSFNGSKAIHYENLASRSAFEAYFTLVRRDDNILVDCVYSNIRNERNGVLINKAVCGLDMPLTKGYENTLYKFSEEWKDSTANVAIDLLLNTPPARLEVEEVSAENIQLLRVYREQEDLISTVPEAVIKRDNLRHTFGSHLVFPVYQARDLTTPVYLDVTSDDLQEGFFRYGWNALNELF